LLVLQFDEESQKQFAEFLDSKESRDFLQNSLETLLEQSDTSSSNLCETLPSPVSADVARAGISNICDSHGQRWGLGKL